MREATNRAESLDQVRGASVSPAEFNLDQLYTLGYTTYAGKPIIGLDGVVDHIDSGANLAVAADGVITYAFADFQHALGLNNNPSFGEGPGYAPFTAEQRTAARTAISYWDDLIPQTFQEVKPGPGASSWAKNDVDIWLQNSTTGPLQAWAYYPGYEHQYKRVSSDVWTADPAWNWSNNWFSMLGYGNTTLVHELGHTLGLSHPGAYNFDPNVTQDYAGLAEYAQDSTQYSIMSYWDPIETGARIINWTGLLYGYAQTPMLHDIYTIQQKYGADTQTRADNTVYGFGSNAGQDIYDFAKNPYPFLTVYDAGGNDTINLSGFTISQFVDLHAGSFSSIGAGLPSASSANAYLANLSQISGEDWGTYDAALWTNVMTNFRVANEASIGNDLMLTGHVDVDGIYASEYQNFSIAYGVTIENATGGSARDLLWGNQVANTLRGMGGSDVLNGFEGADTLYGGAGNDTFMFSQVEKGDRIMDWNAGDKIDLREMDANSTLAGTQHFTFINGGGAFTGVAGQLHYVGGVLEGDVNGDGLADFTVALLGSPTIGASDLIL
ncbi:MAG: M10 family metallopeptidase C-terminal domain-containing protein [Sphingomicrobium sp.]